MAEGLEEEFRAGLGQGHQAELIDDQQSETGQLALEVEQLALVPGLQKFVDQGHFGGQAHRAQAQGLLHRQVDLLMGEILHEPEQPYEVQLALPGLRPPGPAPSEPGPAFLRGL